MPENFLPLHTVYHVGQPIGLGIEVGGVDLINVAGKYHFCTFGCTGNNGLYLMRGKVLRFIDDAEGIGKTPTANLSQCFYYQTSSGLHLLQSTIVVAVERKLTFDDIEIIEKRLHVGRNLLFFVSGKESQVFIRQ